jgi:hypothetical protein
MIVHRGDCFQALKVSLKTNPRRRYGHRSQTPIRRNRGWPIPLGNIDWSTFSLDSPFAIAAE